MGIIFLSYLPALIGMFIMAMFVIIRQRHLVYTAFSTTLFTIIAWLLFQFISFFVSIEAALWVTRLSLVASNFVTPAFLIFAILYPSTRTTISLRSVVLIMTPAVVMSCLTFLPSMVKSAERDGYDLILQTGFLYDIQTLLSIIYIIIALVFLLRKYIKEKGKERVAILMLFFAFFIPMIVGLLSNYFWIEVSGSQYLLPVTLFVTFLIIAYAIVRHKLFDIRLAIARGLAYILLLVTLFTIYVGAVFIVTRLLFGDEVDGASTKQTIVYFIFALFLAITYNPLKQFFDKATNTVFYRQDYTSQHVLSRFSTTIANEIDLEHLSVNVIKLLFSKIKPEFAYLHVRPRKNQTARRTYLGTSLPPLDTTVIKMIDKYDDKVIMVDYMDESQEILQDILKSKKIDIIVRLETAHDKVGYLLLGQKLNGSGYSSKERSFFKNIGNELALALQNSLRFEEIQGFTKTLEGKIESATHRLRTTNHKLRELDVAKDEFVGMASHQLRTPLTSVKGYISMVLEGDAGRISAMQRQLLGEAYTSSERMVHLINDFLNVSRLQTGKFIIDQRPVDLSKVIKQEVDSLKTTAHAHALKLEYRAPAYFPLLAIDEGKIRQVAMNFIDNAIYYSPEHTIIEVKLYIDKGDAVLEVHDSGIGVPAAEMEHLFSKFFRASNARKQRPDGTGVGLFLAKKVVVAHGGRITFSSVEHEGSVFGFRLPIKKLTTDNTN